jgi:hypothetical protein
MKEAGQRDLRATAPGDISATGGNHTREAAFFPAEPPVYLDRLSNERAQRQERFRKIYADNIERRVMHLKDDMESIVRHVKSLMDNANPPLCEEHLKAVADARLALQESLSAILAIDLTRSDYTKKLIRVEQLQAAE